MVEEPCQHQLTVSRGGLTVARKEVGSGSGSKATAQNVEEALVFLIRRTNRKPVFEGFWGM